MLIRKRSILFLLGLLSTIPGCSTQFMKHYDRQRASLKKQFVSAALPEGPVTVFVHGSKSSFTSKIIHRLDYAHGLISTTLNTTDSVLANIAITLCTVSPEEFPRERFFFYSWPGTISFPSRLQAAEKLYTVIKHHKGPITIITHSHGCNVALNLAYWAEVHHDTRFKVDRLILIAPPVQEVTKNLALEDYFKEIYTFYSTADTMQVADPQALYWESHGWTAPTTNIPFFSKRTFDPAPHIIQTRVLQDWQSPSHLQLMLTRFIKKLPVLLKLVKMTASAENYECTKNEFIVNIPPLDFPPHLVTQSELKNHYTPRGNYYKYRQLKKRSTLQPCKAS